MFLQYKRKSTEGVAVMMFVLTVLGNVFYGLSIIMENTTPVFIVRHFPWLVGSLGTLCFDCIVSFKKKLCWVSQADKLIMIRVLNMLSDRLVLNFVKLCAFANQGLYECFRASNSYQIVIQIWADVCKCCMVHFNLHLNTDSESTLFWEQMQSCLPRHVKYCPF